jgi:hypothetical protein
MAIPNIVHLSCNLALALITCTHDPGKHEGITKYTIGQRARIPGRVDANKCVVQLWRRVEVRPGSVCIVD